ncbi:MAG: histidine phosphatase family protein [bacterium]|nr:histidine phosphatase family protein [bacterium]
MLKIYLARHGQNVDNVNGVLNGHRDKPLTKKGIEQAHEVANKIKGNNLHFDFIYTSPLKRASKTAEIISDTINGSKPVEMIELIERDFGVMTGEKQSRIEELCAPDIIKAELITYFLNPKGAETFPDLVKRADELLLKVKNKHKDGNILLVTHGDFGKMIYAAYYNLHWKEVLELFHFGNSELLLLSPNSQAGEAHVFKILQHNH